MHSGFRRAGRIDQENEQSNLEIVTAFRSTCEIVSSEVLVRAILWLFLNVLQVWMYVET